MASGAQLTARDALAAARAAGIEVHAEGTALHLSATSEPLPEVVEALAAHKAELIELLGAEATEALTRDTAARVRSGLAGYPADEAERAERLAIRAETAMPMAPAAEHAREVAGLMEVTHLRPPRFTAPARWWSAERVAVCTGCGTASTWRPDPPPAPNPARLCWQCVRCFPRAKTEERSA